MKLGTIEHPKTAALARALGVDLLMAVGLLESLWHFTARYARRGDVGRFADQDIAAGVHWPGSAADLIVALVGARWLDQDASCRLIVHDWADHAESWVKGNLARTGSGFVTPNGSQVVPPAISVPTENNLSLLREAAPAARQGILKGSSSALQEGGPGETITAPTAGDLWNLEPFAAAALAAIPARCRRGPGAFRKAFAAAVQERGADPQALVDAVAAYYASPHGRGEYHWDPKTFLGDGHWQDPPEAWLAQDRQKQPAATTWEPPADGTEPTPW